MYISKYPLLYGNDFSTDIKRIDTIVAFPDEEIRIPIPFNTGIVTFPPGLYVDLEADDLGYDNLKNAGAANLPFLVNYGDVDTDGEIKGTNYLWFWALLNSRLNTFDVTRYGDGEWAGSTSGIITEYNRIPSGIELGIALLGNNKAIAVSYVIADSEEYITVLSAYIPVINVDPISLAVNGVETNLHLKVIKNSPIEDILISLKYQNGDDISYINDIDKLGACNISLTNVEVVEGNYVLTEDEGSIYIELKNYSNINRIITLEAKSESAPYIPGGTTGSVNQTGGGGSYGKLPDGSIEQSDPIDIPNGTVASPATATGFFTRYLADTNTISTFGSWLWTTDLGLQVAKAVISLIYGDPAQSVISLMSYPFNISTLPGVLQSTGNIVWGNFNSGISSDILNNQASQIDWGSIQLYEYWGNFLDYAPHTKVSLYLPWGTGFVDLDPGECLPGTLNVKTNIDFSKGSCVHNVFGNGNLIGSFAGQCAQQIPVLSSDFASKVAGLVTAAAAGISASAVGGAGVLAEAAMGFPNATISGGDDKVLASFSDAKRAAGRIATTSLAINRHPVNVTRNGGFTDGSAALGCQYPYVIISRPKQSMPEQYGSYFGYPSNIYRQLGTLTGYTEVGEIHLEGIPATDAELSELDRILKGGVIF